MKTKTNKNKSQVFEKEERRMEKNEIKWFFGFSSTGWS
jgi:hypothetical protein